MGFRSGRFDLLVPKIRLRFFSASALVVVSVRYDLRFGSSMADLA